MVEVGGEKMNKRGWLGVSGGGGGEVEVEGERERWKVTNNKMRNKDIMLLGFKEMLPVFKHSFSEEIKDNNGCFPVII